MYVKRWIVLDFCQQKSLFRPRRMQFVWCCAADVAQTQRVQLGSDESRCRRGWDEESSGQDTARDHRQRLVARQRPPAAAAAAFTHVTVCQCSRLWHQPLTATDHRLQSRQRLWGALSLYCASWHWCKHTHTHTHPFNGPFFRDYPGELVPERQDQSWFYWSKIQWVAVALAGPYASLHLAPDR